MLSFARQSIIVTEPSWVDDRGTPRPDYDAPLSTVTVDRCSVQPGASSEDLQNRTQVSIRYNVFAPAGTVISDFARVTVKGRHYQVSGSPEEWDSPTGAISHVVVNLVDWEG